MIRWHWFSKCAHYAIGLCCAVATRSRWCYYTSWSLRGRHISSFHTCNSCQLPPPYGRFLSGVIDSCHWWVPRGAEGVNPFSHLYWLGRESYLIYIDERCWVPNESKHGCQIGNTGETLSRKQTAEGVNVDICIERSGKGLTWLLFWLIP